MTLWGPWLDRFHSDKTGSPAASCRKLLGFVVNLSPAKHNKSSTENMLNFTSRVLWYMFKYFFKVGSYICITTIFQIFKRGIYFFKYVLFGLIYATEKQSCTTGIKKCNKSAYLSHVLSTVKQFVGKSRIYRKKHLYMLIRKTSFLTYCKTWILHSHHYKFIMMNWHR